MKNIFIDCGANIGQGFDRLLAQYPQLNTQDLIVHMFEPLPDACKILRSKYPRATIHQNAVWKDKIERVLNIEHLEILPGAILGHTTNILENNFKIPKHTSADAMNEWPPKHSISVMCIDLSNFIAENFSPDDNITLKLDIEGSEFEVLDKMILDDTLKYITNINVEWHPHMRKDTPAIEPYIEKINSLNIMQLIPAIQ